MRIHRQIINQLLSGMEQVSAIIHNKDLSPQEKLVTAGKGYDDFNYAGL